MQLWIFAVQMKIWPFKTKCCLGEPYHKRWGILLQFCSSLFSLDLGPHRIPETACVTVASSPWCEVSWQHNETMSNIPKSGGKALACPLTHWGRVKHICVNKLAIIGSDSGLSPIHYLSQCSNIDSNHRSKVQWNLKRNSYSFIRENEFENVWIMAAIFPRP